MRTLITNIKTLYGLRPSSCLRLCGADMRLPHSMDNAWLALADGMVEDYGDMCTLSPEQHADEVIDARGGLVLPAFCDSHTHLVYAGSREHEWEDKIRGLSYAEVARRGGGILNSADLLHQTSEEELFRQAMERMREIMDKGTGCVEIKSGYGLNTADELKILRVIRRIKEHVPIRVVSTFLGAHAVARDYTGRQADYVSMVINEMLPEVAKEKLADFVDVFCDKGFFTPDETDRILTAADKYGLKPKVHVDELASCGGLPVCVRHRAVSVDHLENMDENDIPLLKDSDTMPTLLPGTSFFSNMPYGKGRAMIDRGLAVALASDYNPGSTPSGDMRFVMSLACMKMRLLPTEALNAVTVNGAAAMGLSGTHGSIRRGIRPGIILTKPIPSLAYLPYAYTTPCIERTFF